MSEWTEIKLPENGQCVEFSTQDYGPFIGHFTGQCFVRDGNTTHAICRVTRWRPAPTAIDRLVEFLEKEGWTESLVPPTYKTDIMLRPAGQNGKWFVAPEPKP